MNCEAEKIMAFRSLIIFPSQFKRAYNDMISAGQMWLTNSPNY